MKRLNGWKRIGIVASVAWAIVAYVYTFNTMMDGNSRTATAITESCIAANHGQELPNDGCMKQGEQYMDGQYRFEVEQAAFCALVPIPLLWGFAYLMLFLVRWIKRGFVKDAAHG